MIGYIFFLVGCLIFGTACHIIAKTPKKETAMKEEIPFDEEELANNCYLALEQLVNLGLEEDKAKHYNELLKRTHTEDEYLDTLKDMQGEVANILSNRRVTIEAKLDGLSKRKNVSSKLVDSYRLGLCLCKTKEDFDKLENMISASSAKKSSSTTTEVAA